MTLIMDPASGVTLGDMVASLVRANHEKVSKAILDFYDGIVKSSVSIINT